MKRCGLSGAVVAGVLGVLIGSATGQTTGLFGERTLGVGSSSSARDRGATGSSSAGQITGNERFVRENRQPGQFVGADTQDTRSFFSQVDQGGAGGSRGSSGIGNRNSLGTGNRNQFGLGGAAPFGFGTQGQFGSLGSGRTQAGGRSPAGRTGSRGRIAYRATLHVGFAHPQPGAADVSARLQARLAKIPAIHGLTPLTVTVHQRTATLRGTVATEHDRRIAVQLALLEPGVGSVQNELTVGPPAEGPSKSVPAREKPIRDSAR